MAAMDEARTKYFSVNVPQLGPVDWQYRILARKREQTVAEPGHA